MEIEQKFENLCRICTVEHEVGIMIFSEEGEKMLLRDKIIKYLHVQITCEDRLPKMICIGCCTQLDSVKVFSEMALQSQLKLRHHLEVIDHLNTSDKSNPIEEFEVKLEEVTGNSENGIKIEYPIDDESDVTEMEVTLDPMMFLDYHTDGSQSCEESGEESNNEESIPELSASDVNIHNEITNRRSKTLTIELLPKSTPFRLQNSVTKTKVLPDLKPIRFIRKINSNSHNLKPFVCTLCPRSFLSSIALQNHAWLHLKNKIRDNGSMGRVVCPVCKKDISTKGNLKVHMETHRPKGKYNCDICGRIFKTQSNLLRHKEYHGGQVYTCGVCGRVYPTNSTLRAHSITHSDARPHNCPLCKKTFKRNQDLKFHINQHTGARPYRCPYCPKAFASSGNCFSHRKRMHPFEVQRDRDKSHLQATR